MLHTLSGTDAACNKYFYDTLEVLLQCVGCGEGIEARVSYIAPRASYRPPILYSRNQSEKLVFLVEAIPQSSVERLHPGQPLTVVFPR